MAEGAFFQDQRGSPTSLAGEVVSHYPCGTLKLQVDTANSEFHQLKRCPTCGSVSLNNEVECGVCGGSLAEASYESMGQIERDQAAEMAEEERKERRVVRRTESLGIVATIALVILGIGSLVGGILVLGQFNNLGSLLLVLLGMILLLEVLGVGIARPMFRKYLS